MNFPSVPTLWEFLKIWIDIKSWQIFEEDGELLVNGYKVFVRMKILWRPIVQRGDYSNNNVMHTENSRS